MVSSLEISLRHKRGQRIKDVSTNSRGDNFAGAVLGQTLKHHVTQGGDGYATGGLY